MAKVEYDYEVREIPLDANLPKVMEQLAAEGWVIAPGTTPMGIYKLVRNPESAIGSFIRADLHIDDSKVHVVGPDGRIKQ